MGAALHARAVPRGCGQRWEEVRKGEGRECGSGRYRRGVRHHEVYRVDVGTLFEQLVDKVELAVLRRKVKGGAAQLR
jgi:hypothetical protein